MEQHLTPNEPPKKKQRRFNAWFADIARLLNEGYSQEQVRTYLEREGIETTPKYFKTMLARARAQQAKSAIESPGTLPAATVITEHRTRPISQAAPEPPAKPKPFEYDPTKDVKF